MSGRKEVRAVVRAANTIASRLEKEIKVLRAALKPFARIALERDERPDAEDHISGVDLAITPDHVRRARKALDTPHA
jgi:hypothetical protein